VRKDAKLGTDEELLVAVVSATLEAA